MSDYKILLHSHAERIWYSEQIIKNGWSRTVLVMRIEPKLHKRKGKAVNNFALTLPEPYSDLVKAKTLKLSYAWMQSKEFRSRVLCGLLCSFFAANWSTGGPYIE